MFECFKNCQVGEKGMVAAAHPLAAMGLSFFRRKCNDASYHGKCYPSVVLPHVAYGTRFDHYDAATGDTVALNGSGIR